MEVKDAFPSNFQERPELFLINTTSELTFESVILNETQEIAKFGLVSDVALQYVFTINFSIVCGALSLFGIIANIINVAVFIKMGFKETINISLLALSISDLCSLIPLLWNSICLNPLFMYSDIPLYSFEVHLKTGNWTHFIFMRVTAFITTYITFERCLCIVFPLKVKRLLTHKRVVVIIVGIYVFCIAGLSPNYASAKIAWKFIPQRNRTMIGFVFTENRQIIQTVSYVFNVFFIFVTFVGVTTCSSVLIWKLNLRSKWLREASSQDETASQRDRQVIQMVVWVAVIFIVCFTPSLVLFFAAALVPELNLGKRFENLFIVLGSVFFIFDAINSSVNIFIYFKMSSRYSQMFKMFFFREDKAANLKR